ncbi:hypothetical protein SAMN05421636_11016 [Pricia antarctica]|uniref:Uncharacterized protein n=1 Tax=Pricia antarctica TaxID=641691 RepID=A0A1G7HQX7_9FLAO|nr:hypothetical protein [Pricia antarctica]SDF02830.1 hypothetical protein SAMN05421636_11016 [Pricia antarctica]
MKKEIINNSDLHFEHTQWRSELLFWEDELKTFNNRLEELVIRWTNKDVLAQLEHFQNQFIRHGEVIDTLQHDINVHETNMAAHNEKGEDVINVLLAKNHIAFRERMETQRKIYGDLKKEFYRFLSRFM